MEREEAEWMERMRRPSSFSFSMEEFLSSSQIFDDHTTSPTTNRANTPSDVPLDNPADAFDDLLPPVSDAIWKEILARPGMTVESLFEEPGGNIVEIMKLRRYEFPDLITYFTDPDTLYQLINLITLPLEEDQDTANNGCALEILAGTIPEIDSKVVRTPSLMDALFAFWKDSEVQPLLANAVTRVMSSLLSTKEREFVHYMRTKNPTCASDMLAHIHCGAVKTFWVAFVRQNEKAGKSGLTNLNWLVSLGFVEKLIDTFAAAHTATHAMTADIFVEMIDSLGWESPLLQRMVAQTSCSKFFDYLFEPGNTTGARYVPMVYNHLLSTYFKFLQDHPDKKPALDSVVDALPPLIREPLVSMPDIVLYLDKAPGEKMMTDRNRRQHRSFGWIRYALLDTIDLLLSFDFYIVIDTLLYDTVNFFVIAMNLFVDFEHCAFGQRLIYAIFHTAITTQPPEIIIKVIQMANIPAELIGLELQNSDLIAQGDAPLQFIPYVWNIGYLLQSLCCSEVGEEIINYIEKTPGWSEFNQKLLVLKEEELQRIAYLQNVQISVGKLEAPGGLRSSVENFEANRAAFQNQLAGDGPGDLGDEGLGDDGLGGGLDDELQPLGDDNSLRTPELDDGLDGESLDDMLAGLSPDVGEGGTLVDDLDALLGDDPTPANTSLDELLSS